MLVDYSDSDTPDSPPPPSKKRKLSPTPTPTLPPLPPTFHDLYASAVRPSNRDDPSLHAGRQRQTPHVEGNWPTHVYIECFLSFQRLHALINNLTYPPPPQEQQEEEQDATKIHTLLQSDLGAPQALHISLSRPLVLRGEQRAPFLEALKAGISRSGLQPFALRTAGLDWVANFDRTRWFLVLRLQKAPQDALNVLLRITNDVAAGVGQPPLYQQPLQKDGKKRHDHLVGRRGRGGRFSTADPSPRRQSYGDVKEDCSECFHVSIAWTLQAPSDEMRERTRLRNQADESFEIEVERVKVKMGNVVSAIVLSKGLQSANGILEGR